MESGIDGGNQVPKLPQEIIRVETALSRYPAHRLSKKGEIDINIVEPCQNGEARVRWSVSHNSRHGQPGPLAYKIDTLVVNRKIEESKRPVPRLIRLGSLSGLCRDLDLVDSGTNRSNIKEALRQNAFAGISAKIVYRQSDGRERSLEADFTRYSVVFTGESFPDDEGRKADAVYIILNDIFMQVLNGAMTRPLDYEYLKGLPAGPQRFYELLSYQIFAALKHKLPEARLVYSEFCAYAPQTRYFDSNRVHKQMAKIHAPHKDSGYIEDVKFHPTVDADRRPDWVMAYTPGPRAEAEFRAFTKRGGPKILEVEVERPQVPDAKPELTGLEKELTSRGVTEATARELVAGYAEERIRRQIELVDWRAKEQKKVKDLGAYLAKAIRDDFAPPEGFVSKAQRERREAAEREATRRSAEDNREKQKRQRRDTAIHRKVTSYWEALGPAERKALDAAALREGDPEAVASYREIEAKNPLLASATFRIGIRDPYIRQLLGLNDDPQPSAE
jgi:hypothetical protein